MEKELQLDRSRKMLAGVVAGVQRTYLPKVDLAVLRAGLVLLVAFVHPLSALIVSMYGLL